LVDIYNEYDLYFVIEDDNNIHEIYLPIYVSYLPNKDVTYGYYFNKTHIVPKNEVYVYARSDGEVFINMLDDNSPYIEKINMHRVTFEKKINYKKYFVGEKLSDQEYSIILLSDDCLCFYDGSWNNERENKIKYIYDLSKCGIIIKDIHKIWILHKKRSYIQFIQMNSGTIYVCDLQLENPILNVIDGFNIDTGIEIITEKKYIAVCGAIGWEGAKQERKELKKILTFDYLIISKVFIYKYTLNNGTLVLLQSGLNLTMFNSFILQKIKFNKNIVTFCDVQVQQLIKQLILCNKYTPYKRTPIYLLFEIIKYAHPTLFI
jgi:hypothetical protein